MTAVTKYTDTASIRAALGVSSKELKEDVLLAVGLDDRLLSELADWLPTHEDIHTAGTGETPTAQEETNYRNLRLYSQYYCASCLDLRLAAANTIGDGKNIMKRFTGVDFEKLTENMAGTSAIYRKRLELEVNAIAEIPLVLIGLAEPDYDPVTNT